MSVKKLVVCSMCVPLAVVTNLIRIYTFPFGGSVTLFSMLFIMLPAWLYGIREGAAAGLLFGILQFIIEPYFLSIIQFFLDYILAFSIMSLAGLVRNKKNGLITGYIIAVTARWIVATLAGLAWFSAGMSLEIWKEWRPLPYSMVYNAIYIYAEAAVTVIILLVPAVRRALEHVRSDLYN